MLDNEQHFLNRELSWLKFNDRVLNEANDLSKPLLERLKFVAIASSNLDEFFMIRIAGLKQQVESGIAKKDTAGLNATEQLRLIDHSVRAFEIKKYRLLKKIMGCMEQEELFFRTIENLTTAGREWMDEYFYNTIYPILTPLAINASHPFPLLANKSLNLAVLLSRGKEENQIAIIPVPSVLPRIIEVPDQNKGNTFVFLEDVITSYCAYLFGGYLVKEVILFRITRNADLLIDGEGAEDLLVEVEKSLRLRKRGEPVRLEISRVEKSFLKRFLLEAFKIAGQDVYKINGRIDVSCFMNITGLPGYDHLRHEPLITQTPICLQGVTNLFDVIRDKDILLHHPYESFRPVVNFIHQAAIDPKVLAIKQTLYRVSGNSSIVKALVQAAENGKQVTVVIEVRARFDEENNILWARRLEEAGCHVIYGVVGLKVHGKMALIIRQEDNCMRRYIHMGTGNYNDTTARLYTDMSLFTADKQMGVDACKFFNMLLGYSEPTSWEKLVVAPLGLRTRLGELIDREIKFAETGKGGHIIAKMNSLLDKDIIIKLYEASCKGVKIELIVRGICSLRPGIEGVSNNITVRSIVGRFLEHHRISYFANGGKPDIYLSSADWMNRNLSERVELMFPIDDQEIIARVKGILEIMLKDNRKAYIMKSDGNYGPVHRHGRAINSQEELCREAESKAGVPLP